MFPSRSGTVAAPSLRSWQGRVRCCLYHGVCHAQRPASDLRRNHLHFITTSCYRRLPFLRTARSRDTFLSILEQTRQRYRFVVVGYVVMPEHIHLLLTEPEVGTPSTVMQVLKQRTGSRFVVQAQTEEPAPTQSVCRRAQAPSVLAGTLLRLQRMDDEEARGKAQVYASQSTEARPGRCTGGMALEQLSFLSSGRSRAGEGE